MAHLGWIAAGIVFAVAVWLLLVGQPAASQATRDLAVKRETEVTWLHATVQAGLTPTPVVVCYYGTRRC